jgi:hypothetical protein
MASDNGLQLLIMDPDQALPDLNRCFYVGPAIPGISKGK